MIHNSTSGYLPKRTEFRDLKEYLYALIHSIIIYNNQKVETTQKSINK
jgi:hypothetical protein